MFENRLRPHVPERKRRISHRERVVQSIKMRNTPLEAGVFAALSPLPCLLTGVFLDWIVIGIAFALVSFNYFVIPDVVIETIFIFTGFIPFAFSPVLGILGVIHSIIQRKTKGAWLGLLLSAFCLLENTVLFVICGYLGSKY